MRVIEIARAQFVGAGVQQLQEVTSSDPDHLLVIDDDGIQSNGDGFIRLFLLPDL